MRARDIAQAEECFREAIKLDGKHSPSLLAFGVLLCVRPPTPTPSPPNRLLAPCASRLAIAVVLTLIGLAPKNVLDGTVARLRFEINTLRRKPTSTPPPRPGTMSCLGRCPSFSSIWSPGGCLLCPSALQHPNAAESYPTIIIIFFFFFIMI